MGPTPSDAGTRQSSPPPPIVECETSPHYQEGLVRDARALIRLGRGDIAGAEEDRAFHLDQGRRIKDPQRLLPGLATAAVHRLILGDKVGARVLAEEALELARAHDDMAVTANHLIFVAGQIGLRDEYLQSSSRRPKARGRT